LRNLSKDETIEMIIQFGKNLQSVKINNKQLVTASDAENIFINEKISIDEIKNNYPIQDSNILSFVRQLYFRAMPVIIRERVKDPIANIPTVSFTINNNVIHMNY